MLGYAADRDRHADDGASAGFRIDVDSAAEKLGAFTHPLEPETGAMVQANDVTELETHPVVIDLNAELAALDRKRDLNGSRLRVQLHVS